MDLKSAIELGAFAADTAVELGKNIPSILDHCTQTVEALERLTTTANSSFEHVIDTLNSSKYATIRKKEEFKDLKYSLKNAAVMMHRYADTVNDISYYCSKEEEHKRIVDALGVGDYQPLLRYLETLKKCISLAMDEHKIAQEEFKKVQSESASAAEYCKREAQKAKKKKRIARVVGGTVGTITAGGGIVVSGVVGGLTFGLGAPIVAGITAVVVPVVTGAATAATTGVVTHIVASDYNKGEQSFRRISTDFDDLNTVSSRMLLDLDKFHSSIISLSRKEEITRESANYDIKNPHSSTASIIEAANCLFHAFGNFYERSTPCQYKMEEIKNKMCQIEI